MAAPRKPWERPGVNYHSISNSNGNGLNSNSIPFGPSRPNILTQIGGGGGGGSYLSTPIPGKDLPPPLPPRPYSAGQSSSTFGYGYSPYSTFGSYPSYSSPFSYGGYGRYGFPSMSFGSYGTPDNNFIQLAEDSSRPAFQSIESIVQAVQSVSMMLESTYSALYSSFRAVIGVAHHFSHMKTQIAQIFSALAIFRSLRFLCRKVLYLLGIRSTNPTADQIWSSVSGTAADNQCSGLSETDVKRQQSNWPIIMFFAVVFGAPWLIWKLLSSVTGMHKEVNKHWMTGQREHYMAVALFDFGAESDKELSFKAGQSIRLAPKEMQPKVRGWLLGTTDGKTSGLVPANYISILKKSDGLEHQEGTASVTKNNTEHDSLLIDHSQTLPCNKELVESTVSDTESSLT